MGYIHHVDGSGIIPFKNENFDVVFSCLVLQHIHIKIVDKYIEESRRVLTKNGLIMFHCTEWPDFKSDRFFLENKDEELELEYLSGGMYSHTKDVMEELFIKHGFKLIDYKRVQDEHHLKKANAFWLMYVAQKI